MKKLNILIVHNYYQIPGGEDTVVANEKKMLEEYGHKVVLYTRSNTELSTFSKLQKLSLPFTTIFNPRTYRDIKNIIKEHKIDIVHVHNTLNLVSPSAYYAALKTGVPVVQTIHNFRLLCPKATFYRDGHICEDCVSKGLSCAIKHNCYRDSRIQTLACVINILFHRHTGIYKKIYYICLTDFNKDKLLLLNRPGKKKRILSSHIWVKPNFANDVLERVPYDKRKNQFIYAGRLDPSKGLSILLNAWKLLGRDAPELIICGNGPLEDWCKQYISENHLSQVKMKGSVSNQTVRQLIGNSKALILPTQWYEGFPMTIVEAFSMYTPVIGSNMGNVGNLIHNGKNGYTFQYDSSQDLANAVVKMINCSMSFSQDEFEKYSYKENYKLLTDIYNQIINFSPASNED